jgi:hypothetical protein
MPAVKETLPMRLRTYLLLALAVASGTGIAVFSMYADGMYSAICLLFFPFFSLLMFASIAFDIARPRVAVARPREAKAVTVAAPSKVATIKPVTTAAVG